jgi:hypothetical protein
VDFSAIAFAAAIAAATSSVIMLFAFALIAARQPVADGPHSRASSHRDEASPGRDVQIHAAADSRGVLATASMSKEPSSACSGMAEQEAAVLRTAAPDPTPVPGGSSVKPRRAFISYAHEPEVHRQRVLDLANRLRRDGIESQIDHYTAAPTEGWSCWMYNEFKKADRVIVVCSTKYLEHVDGTSAADEGLGVAWEWHHIKADLYKNRGRGARIVLVWFDPEGSSSQPPDAWDRAKYDVGDLGGQGYQALLRDLKRESEAPPPPVAEST